MSGFDVSLWPYRFIAPDPNTNVMLPSACTTRKTIMKTPDRASPAWRSTTNTVFITLRATATIVATSVANMPAMVHHFDLSGSCAACAELRCAMRAGQLHAKLSTNTVNCQLSHARHVTLAASHPTLAARTPEAGPLISRLSRCFRRLIALGSRVGAFCTSLLALRREPQAASPRVPPSVGIDSLLSTHHACEAIVWKESEAVPVEECSAASAPQMRLPV